MCVGVFLVGHQWIVVQTLPLRVEPPNPKGRFAAVYWTIGHGSNGIWQISECHGIWDLQVGNGGTGNRVYQTSQDIEAIGLEPAIGRVSELQRTDDASVVAILRKGLALSRP